METTSHSLAVPCLGQGDLGPVWSTQLLFVPLHNVNGDNASWNVFPGRDWNTQPFQRREFLWLYFMPILHEPELRWKNVRNSQQRKPYMKKSKMLKRQGEKFHSRSLHLHSGNIEGWSPPQNPAATSPGPLWRDLLQHCSAPAWPCVTEPPWAFSRINSALLHNWFQRV